MSNGRAPFAATPRIPPPLPPHPLLGIWLLRIGVTLVSLAWLGCQSGRAWLLPWAAEAQHAVTQVGMPDLPRRVGAHIVTLLAQPTSPLIWVPFLSLVLLLAEAVSGMLVAATLRTTVLTGTRTYYRVRTLHPLNRTTMPETQPTALWTALLASLAGLGRDQVALTLSRTANLPAQLGVQVRGLKHIPADTRPSGGREPGDAPDLRMIARRRARGPLIPPPLPDTGRAEPEDAVVARRMVEGVLRRMDETAQLEPWPDPLGVVAPGMVVFSQELVLARAPHWPLAVPEHADGGLLRALAHALAVPEGVVVQEYQILATPTREHGSRRWIPLARRWLARLHRSGSATLVGDIGAAREVALKLSDSHATVTIRLVVVAQSRDPAHVTTARASLAVMRAALADLSRDHTLPYGSVLQSLVPAAPPRVDPIRRVVPVTPKLLHRVRLAVLIALMVALLYTAGLIGAYVTGSWRIWGDLPWLVRVVSLVVWWTTLLLAGLTSLWQLALIQPWVVLRRVARRRDGNDPILPVSALWQQPAILSSSEVSRLWHLPDPQAGSAIAWTPNRILPAPASAVVPEGPEAGRWLTLGHAFDSGGQLRPVGVPLRALHQMMHITAGMGAGKSQAAAAMCAQLIPHGFIILDGKGDDEGGSLATVVRRLIPPGEEHRLAFLNVLETAYPIGLNPIYHFMVAMEQATGKADRDLSFNAALGLILGLFERLDPERWQASPGMQQYALMASHLVLRTGSSQPGAIPTMAKVARALDDTAYRNALIARYPFKNDLVYRFWTQREEQLSEAQKTSLQALLRRLDLFMANPITRPMLTVEQPSVDLRRAMDEGQIIIIPMPHRNLGGLGPLVGMLILQSIVAAAYARPGDAQSRITAPVFIDEVQVFVVNDQSPDLEQAFTQLRGFGVPMIVLHQTLTQIGALKETFTINAANRLILRTGEPDATEYARMYAQAGLRPEDIKGMEALHHQYAVTLGPNREQLIFSLRPNAWPVPPEMMLPPLPAGMQTQSWKQLTPLPDPSWSAQEQADYAEADQIIAAIIYQDQSPAEFDRIAGQFAQLPADLWEVLLDQWERIRAHHYQELLRYPAQEPGQIARQTWLTNLRASRGALIEEALALRQELGVIQGAPVQVHDTVPTPSELNPPPGDVLPVDPAAVAVLPATAATTYPTAEELARTRRMRPSDMPGIANYVLPPREDETALVEEAEPEEAESAGEEPL